MKHFRNQEVNKYRAGRDEGFCATDDFTRGLDTLKKTKLKSYITKSCSYSDILGMQQTTEESNLQNTEDDDQLDETMAEEPETNNSPPPHIITSNGELCLIRIRRGSTDI